MGYIMAKLQTVAETPTFTQQADKIFTEEEKNSIIDYLAENPTAGDEIPGTGGVRKIRFALQGRGKSGGARVVYYYLDDMFPIYALLAYPKNAKTDLTSDEKKAVRKFVTALKATRKAKK